jgi:hypothetical protein
VILRRLLFYLAGAAALSVSAGVVVVALAYALFALVEPFVGPAGAAAIVAGSAGVLIGLIGLVLTNMAKPPKPPKRKPGEEESVVERAMDFIRSKPVTSIGTALAAGILMVRNPSYLGRALRSFLEGQEEPKRRR